MGENVQLQRRDGDTYQLNRRNRDSSRLIFRIKNGRVVPAAPLLCISRRSLFIATAARYQHGRSLLGYRAHSESKGYWVNKHASESYPFEGRVMQNW